MTETWKMAGLASFSFLAGVVVCGLCRPGTRAGGAQVSPALMAFQTQLQVPTFRIQLPPKVGKLISTTPFLDPTLPQRRLGWYDLIDPRESARVEPGVVR